MAIALIVAGGQGLRMQMAVRKQYLELEGRPVLQHTLMVFDRCKLIDRIILVVPPSEDSYCKKMIVEPACLSKDIRLVQGGAERQDSVYNGLVSVDPGANEIVVIHDGVRPFVEEHHISNCIQAAQDFGASVLAVPVSDTIKHSDHNGCIDKTIDRNNLWAAQTPQAFRYNLIREAHDLAIKNHIRGTDDASLVEAQGYAIKLVQGSRNNIKITTQEDLVFASSLIQKAH